MSRRRIRRRPRRGGRERESREQKRRQREERRMTSRRLDEKNETQNQTQKLCAKHLGDSCCLPEMCRVHRGGGKCVGGDVAAAASLALQISNCCQRRQRCQPSGSRRKFVEEMSLDRRMNRNLPRLPLYPPLFLSLEGVWLLD